MWLRAHSIEPKLAQAVRRVLHDRPSDPIAAVGRALLEQRQVEEKYAEAVSYIFANADFSGIAKRYQNPQENWERFEKMLELLGQPMQKLKVVHIAGTNGKGTTSALCDAMLRASDSGSVGLFTSPHLHCFRERIRIDGKLTTKEQIVDALGAVRPVVEAVGGASPFEKLTALALVCFSRAGCEWAVLETGLGGRWDCTNHSVPLVCGVTRIGYDHMNVLGNTIAKIASEKAGILKRGVPAYCVPQEPDALAVLRATADEQDVPLEAVEAAWADAPARAAHPPPIWLTPRHQAHNAEMAMRMVHSLYERGLLSGMPTAAIGAEAAQERWLAARDATTWPCRFEVLTPSADVLPRGTPLLLDVAHNEPAIEALVASVVAAYPSAPCAVIFGANSDKDVAKCVRLLCALPRLAAGIAVQSSHPKAVPTSTILEESAQAAGAGGEESVRWVAAATMLEALDKAAATLRGGGGGRASSGEAGVVLCCGSVFVAADMREALAEREPSVFGANDWVFARAGEPQLCVAVDKGSGGAAPANK